MQTDFVFFAKLVPFVIGFVVLAIGTVHSIFRPGEKHGTDRLPPNAYSPDGKDDDISV